MKIPIKMCDKEPLWKLPSNHHRGNCVENGHAGSGGGGKVALSNGIGGHHGSNGGNIITRCCFHLLKCVNVRRCVAALVLLTVVTIVYYTHYVDNSPFVG